MTIDKAIRLAHKWAAGQVCTLREGEAQAYHQLCAEALERSRWIPVTERLPKPATLVLCKGRRDGLFLGEVTIYYENYGEAYCHVPNSRRGRVAVAWMPLPEVTEEDDDEQPS